MAEEENEYFTVQDVMQDLDIKEHKAYEIFARKDFPANCVVRPFKIHREAYNEWKMKRHEREEE